MIEIGGCSDKVYCMWSRRLPLWRFPPRRSPAASPEEVGMSSGRRIPVVAAPALAAVVDSIGDRQADRHQPAPGPWMLVSDTASRATRPASHVA